MEAGSNGRVFRVTHKNKKMSLITDFFRVVLKVVIFTTALCLAIVFIPGLPPHHINFESYEIDPPLKLAPNSILNNAQVLQLDKELDAPESIAIRGDELYFGDQRGKLLKWKNAKVTTVAKPRFPCAHLNRNKCSFPLATRFDPKSGKLVFTDLYGGLLQVNVDTGKVEQLIARDEHIEGIPVQFPEDLDISKNGTIYWSDATTTATLEAAWNVALGHPSGRLLKFEPWNNKSTVLLSNIHFANGVQLSPNEDFVLVAETLRCRVIRYYLKGTKKGQSDIFISGLGYPGNIRSNNNGGFYVSMFPRNSDSVTLESAPLIQKLIARIFSLLDFITRRLYTTFPTEVTKYLNVLVLSITKFPKVDYGNAFILELNEKGEILSSLQNTDGTLPAVSQITVGDQYAYFVSPLNSKIWYIKTKDLKQN